MTITLYHNPACGTSRNVLGLIRNSGIEPTVIEYLKTPPDRATLQALAAASGGTLRDLIRQKGTPYAELGLDDPALSEDALLDAMLQHPILLTGRSWSPRWARACAGRRKRSWNSCRRRSAAPSPRKTERRWSTPRAAGSAELPSRHRPPAGFAKRRCSPRERRVNATSAKTVTVTINCAPS